ncbi:hypothetical protein DAI22_01g363250 [Oryza sativa Japonica Group]|nr:hypothetical protein DAI22_01g363250 [Oryza sativa Japonica Group]
MVIGTPSNSFVRSITKVAASAPLPQACDGSGARGGITQSAGNRRVPVPSPRAWWRSAGAASSGSGGCPTSPRSKQHARPRSRHRQPGPPRAAPHALSAIAVSAHRRVIFCVLGVLCRFVRFTRAA